MAAIHSYVMHVLVFLAERQAQPDSRESSWFTTGEVMSAKVSSCNGDEAVIRSIEKAVMDASPLPKPPNPSLFERDLFVSFHPDL